MPCSTRRALSCQQYLEAAALAAVIATAVTAVPVVRPAPSTARVLLVIRKEKVMSSLVQYVKQFVRDEGGVSAIEYGLIAALIAIVIIGAVKTVGTNLNSVFSTIGNDL
ncbi:flp/Fap pilin component family protein [Burkholderia pseudomallei]|nr:flp/Fap pilin component family protein [Burkholderia pseudomallei]KGD58080.1 flp/Fap pilin component family protein [Burkholderia pseudomallei]